MTPAFGLANPPFQAMDSVGLEMILSIVKHYRQVDRNVVSLRRFPNRQGFCLAI
jgi:3-hydroxyacyl-CoA dehydrogenase